MTTLATCTFAWTEITVKGVCKAYLAHIAHNKFH